METAEKILTMLSRRYFPSIIVLSRYRGTSTLPVLGSTFARYFSSEIRLSKVDKAKSWFFAHGHWTIVKLKEGQWASGYKIVCLAGRSIFYQSFTQK